MRQSNDRCPERCKPATQNELFFAPGEGRFERMGGKRGIDMTCGGIIIELGEFTLDIIVN